MSEFEPAMQVLRDHEGGWSDDPADRGGPTNMGVTLKTLKWALGGAADLNHDGKIDAEDLRLLDPERATGIYRIAFWDGPGFGCIRDQTIATKAFDLGVHAGPHVAIVLLQRAIDHAKPPFVPAVRDDGILGEKTRAALEACDPTILLGAYCSEQAGFYLRIIERDPSQARFKKGWLNRARWPLRDWGVA